MSRRIVGYELRFHGGVRMSLGEVWPDGVPDTHAVEDVRRLIAQDGGAAGVVTEWGLRDYLEVTVSPIYEPAPESGDATTICPVLLREHAPDESCRFCHGSGS